MSVPIWSEVAPKSISLMKGEEGWEESDRRWGRGHSLSVTRKGWPRYRGSAARPRGASAAVAAERCKSDHWMAGGKGGENVDDHEFIEPSLIPSTFIFQVR